MSNKLALVTGGSRGIGAAISKRLAEDNYDVIINYNSNIDAANQIADEIKSEGHKGKIDIYKCNVTSFDESKKMIDDIINEFDRFDILVNNAGISKEGLLMMSKIDKWWDVVHTNLGGTVNCTKHVIPQMIKQKSGKIINISSVSGIRGTVGNSNYSASKAAVIGFTKAMAKELAGFGIHVNCIAPGFIKTDLTGELSEKRAAEIKHMVPLKRMGKVSEVSEMVSLLASGKVDYILGQTIVIDGGINI